MRILLLGKYFNQKKNQYNFLKRIIPKPSIEFIDEFEKIPRKIKKFDIALSYGYGRILNDYDIKKIKCRIINCHIGYLPFARGIYPLLWSLVFKKNLGVTFHLIEDCQIDCGRILYKKKIKFSKRDNLKLLHRKCIDMINKELNDNFKILLNKNLFLKKKHSHYYFNRKVSTGAVKLLPNKWNTTVDYIQKNRNILKKFFLEHQVK
jgi:methionyl-tRNA formyltransferase